MPRMPVTCDDAQEFVSAVYDREYAPPEVIAHIAACECCRKDLDAYSLIGAGIRLAGARALSADECMPALPIPKAARRSWLAGKMLVPKFAIAAAALIFLFLMAGLVTVRAQSHPLWFEYSFEVPASEGVSGFALFRNAVKPGYDDEGIWGRDQNKIAIHMAVLSIDERAVRIAIRARRYVGINNADQISPKKDLGELKGHSYTFTSGSQLQIPVENGTALILQGRVMDHQPLSLYGVPLEPDNDQIVVSSPVLVRGRSVLSNL